MKGKRFLACMIFTAGAMSSVAASVADSLQCGAIVRQTGIERHRDSVYISMKLDLKDMRIESNRSIVLIPTLSGRENKITLPPIEVMGRRRHIYYERNGGLYAQAPYRIVKKGRKDNGEVMAYHVAVPYAGWMDTAEVRMAEDLCGCGEVQNGSVRPVTKADIAFRPALCYVSPPAETVKARAISGSAYLDFPVNKTYINTGYRRNPQELARIRATIDTIRNDKDVSVTGIRIKGYASPEGTYRHNTYLAQERTKSLKEYVRRLYHFPDSIFSLDYEPEDWTGLRKRVGQSALEDKDKIMGIIDDPSLTDADKREMRIRRECPESYAFMLKNFYPALRHSDYRVNYVIRGFSMEEAREIIHTRPQNLSLQEMFAVAQSYAPGSDEFKRVFDVAVRLYPENETANLNAANALLEKGLADEARLYLEKAGKSPQADNARGVALLLKGRYNEAAPLLERAAQAGLKEAEANLKIL